MGPRVDVVGSVMTLRTAVLSNLPAFHLATLGWLVSSIPSFWSKDKQLSRYGHCRPAHIQPVKAFPPRSPCRRGKSCLKAFLQIPLARIRPHAHTPALRSLRGGFWRFQLLWKRGGSCCRGGGGGGDYGAQSTGTAWPAGEAASRSEWDGGILSTPRAGWRKVGRRLGSTAST